MSPFMHFTLLSPLSLMVLRLMGRTKTFCNVLRSCLLSWSSDRSNRGLRKRRWRNSER